MKSQNQRIHDTRNRGPGIEFSASSVVTRSTITMRASSICTKTLTMHAKMTNQSIENPLAAPTFGVTMSSPDPTMAALMMRPGPRCDAMSSHPRGGLRTSPAGSLPGVVACVLELGAIGVWLTGDLEQLFIERHGSCALAGCLCGASGSVQPVESVGFLLRGCFEFHERL